MTKFEAAKLLYISVRTLERRMQAGQIKFTKAVGQFGEVSFTHADLGLPEPTQAPKYNDAFKEYDEPAPAAPKQPQRAFPKPKPTPIETKQAEDRDFADRYLAGEVTDSYGNTIEGTNKLCPTIGPQCGVNELKSKWKDGPPKETQSHMNPALLSDHDSDGTKRQTDFKMGTRGYWEQSQGLEPSCGFTEKGAPLADGEWSNDGRSSQEIYDAMLREHKRSCGTPSMTEQMLKMVTDRNRIRASFPHGTARTASRGLAR